MADADIPIRLNVERLKRRVEALAGRLYSWAEILNKPNTFPPDVHNHNDLYYLKYEVDNLLGELASELSDSELLALLNALGDVVALWALQDEDGSNLRDSDGKLLYSTGDPIDNPLRPTAIFQDVASMLASASDSWDRAYTRNWTGSDGNSHFWAHINDPAVFADGQRIFALDDGGAKARLLSARGADPDDRFVSLAEVNSAISNARYVHHQATPLTSWNVVHPLNCYPGITCTDLLGNVIKGDEQYISTSIIAVAFSRPLSGYVYLD